jgi:hypothetical protein
MGLWAWAVLKELRPWGPAKAFAAAVLLACAGAALAASRHSGHRVYMDEFEHVDIAANVARGGLFGESLAAGRPDLSVVATPTWPGGGHVLWSWFFKAWEPSEALASAVNLGLGAATAVLLFVLCARGFGDPAAGLIAAAAWAFLPLRHAYAGTTELTAPSLFFQAAAYLAAILCAQAPDPTARGLAVLAACLAAHARFENGLLLPLALAFLGRRPEERARLWPWGALAGLLILPVAAIARLNAAHSLPGFSGGLTAAALNLKRQLAGDLIYLARLPAGALLLGLLGWARRDKSERPAALFLAGAAVLYLLAYASFFRGDFGAASEDRYALSALMPLLVLAALGLAALLRRRAWMGALAAAALFCAWPAPADPGGGFRQMEAFARAAAPVLPEDAPVVAFSPPFVVAATGRAAVSPYLLLEAGPVRERVLAAPAVVVFEDWWWARRPEVAGQVRALLAGRSGALLAEAVIDGRKQSFVLLKKK